MHRGGEGGQQLEISSFFYRNLCAGISLPVHMLGASFGRILCTSCICVMVIGLTAATLVVVFGICGFSPVCTSHTAQGVMTSGFELSSMILT